MTYIKRELEPLVKTQLKQFSALGITSPRQSGKSTLLKHLLDGQYQYVTFDDLSLIELFHSDPKRFMATYNNRVIFDEIQKVPELFSYIKIAIDNDRQNKGKYILTGSSQFSMMKSISESLAGRIGLLTLLPFQYSEIPPPLRKESIFRGCYPEIIVQKYEHASTWYSAYINTYLEKDVRTLHNVGDLTDFRRLLNLLAGRTAQTLNMSSFSKELGVSVSTIKRWLSILESSYIIFLLPPYYKNYGKRITKAPKLYFYDTGLVSHLTGISTYELFEKGPMAGSLFENYVISEILKQEQHKNSDAKLYYFRDNNYEEIDLIIDRLSHKELIEIKLNSTFKPTMIKNLEKFLEKQDKAYLIYTGETMNYAGPTQILNYQAYLQT